MATHGRTKDDVDRDKRNKQKVTPKETNGVLIKAVTTIGRAAGKLAALVTSGDKSTKQEPRRTERKPRRSRVKPLPTSKAANVASKKAKKTVSKRKRKG